MEVSNLFAVSIQFFLISTFIRTIKIKPREDEYDLGNCIGNCPRKVKRVASRVGSSRRYETSEERKKRAGLKEGILPRVPWRGSNDSLHIGEREVLFSE